MIKQPEPLANQRENGVPLQPTTPPEPLARAGAKKSFGGMIKNVAKKTGFANKNIANMEANNIAITLPIDYYKDPSNNNAVATEHLVDFSISGDSLMVSLGAGDKRQTIEVFWNNICKMFSFGEGVSANITRNEQTFDQLADWCKEHGFDIAKKFIPQMLTNELTLYWEHLNDITGIDKEQNKADYQKMKNALTK